MFDGPWVAGAVCVLSCIAAFVATLWLTEPKRTDQGPSLSERIDYLRKAPVRDRRSLSNATQAAGLFPSNGVQGAIDRVARLPSGEVEISGWAARIGGTETPLNLVAFVGGNASPVGKTAGPRVDVTTTLKLSPAAARNVGFSYDIQCRSKDTFLLLAIAEDGGYLLFNPTVCP